MSTAAKRSMSASGGDAAAGLRIVRLSDAATAPTRGSAGAAGFDLFAAQERSIPPGDRAVVKTDIQIGLPAGCYGRVAPRSGLAAKHCIDVGAGVVDSDYRGNVMVLLINSGSEAFHVKIGDRIAQLILEKIAAVDVVEVSSLDDTIRGAGGFGSSGLV